MSTGRWLMVTNFERFMTAITAGNAGLRRRNLVRLFRENLPAMKQSVRRTGEYVFQLPDGRVVIAKKKR